MKRLLDPFVLTVVCVALAAAFALLTSCAGVQKVDPAPVVEAVAAPVWPQELRDDLFRVCIANTNAPEWCICVVHETERFSPDPTTPITREEAQQVWGVCGKPPVPDNAI